MNDEPEVHLATTTDELRAIQRFRYEIVVAEQGKAFAGVDHVQRSFAEPIDERAAHFYTLDERGVSGASRLALATGLPPFAAGPVDSFRFARTFDAARVSTSSRIMVRRDARGHKLAGRLAAACFRDGLAHGGLLDFTFCEPHVLPLFRRLGYRPFGPGISVPVGDAMALRVPLVLCLRDRAHLGRCGSIFARVLGDEDDRGETWTRFRSCAPAAPEDPRRTTTERSQQ